jgi:hypothetical protein
MHQRTTRDRWNSRYSHGTAELIVLTCFTMASGADWLTMCSACSASNLATAEREVRAISSRHGTHCAWSSRSRRSGSIAMLEMSREPQTCRTGAWAWAWACAAGRAHVAGGYWMPTPEPTCKKVSCERQSITSTLAGKAAVIGFRAAGSSAREARACAAQRTAS